MVLRYRERREIMNVTGFVQKVLDSQRKIRMRYEKMLEGLPEGKLSSFTRKGRTYYRCTSGGRREYLGSESNPIVAQLKLRAFLEESIAILTANEAAATRFASVFKNPDPASVLKKMSGACRFTDDSVLKSVGLIDADQWGSVAYDKCTLNPKELIHTALDGSRVRSKSELSIINLLISKNMSFRYEENLYLVHGTLSPDFSIFVPSENRVKYLEHCGMMSDPGYVRRFSVKLQNYVDSGYIPWRDVFFTFDSGDGKIDSHAIDALIEMYFR